MKNISTRADGADQHHARLAHDLRNMLTPILLYAEFLETSLVKHALSEEAEMARTISVSVKQINAMIIEQLGMNEPD